MSRETEEIQRQMEDTRASLAEKLGRLESQMGDKVEQAASTVTETAEVVSETVETVQHTFDLHWHAQRHPWLLVGGAVAVGFIGAQLLLPPRRRFVPEVQPPQVEEKIPQPSEEASHPIDQEVSYLRQMGIGTAMGVMGKVLSTVLPLAIAPLASEAVRALTRKMGGRPLDEEPASQEPGR